VIRFIFAQSSFARKSLFAPTFGADFSSPLVVCCDEAATICVVRASVPTRSANVNRKTLWTFFEKWKIQKTSAKQSVRLLHNR